MKLKFLLPIAAFVAAAALTVSACTGDGGGKKPSLVLDQTELALTVGQTATLHLMEPAPAVASLSAEGSDLMTEYVWTSSAPEIASVEATGTEAAVTAVAAGNATITVKYGETILGTCAVTVSEPFEPFLYSVPEGKLVVRKGAVVSVRAGVADDVAEQCVWETSDASVATVEEQGRIAMVTAVSRGECTITVRLGDQSASFTFIVGITG